MLNKANVMKVSVGVVFLMLLAVPKSYADWGIGVRFDDRHPYRYHDHPHFGLHMSFLPRGYSTVWVGHSRYYYYDGLYYNRIGQDYVVEAPPLGAIVSAIPPDYQAIMINGVTYYTDSGTYYVYTRRGYQVVNPPVNVIQPPPVVVAQQPVPAPMPVAQPTAGTEDSFTLNIPSDKGGYTAVVIKKSGSGFVGPQGEFYAEFPKVSQLKVMYGK